MQSGCFSLYDITILRAGLKKYCNFLIKLEPSRAKAAVGRTLVSTQTKVILELVPKFE